MSVSAAWCRSRTPDTVVAFYRDPLGGPEIARFTGHDGYDGVMLDVPEQAPTWSPRKSRA